MSAARLDVLLGLVVVIVTILGYIANLIRRIRKTLRAWEQHQEEHRAVMEVAHWHEYGRVVPLLVDGGPRHRRPSRWPR